MATATYQERLGSLRSALEGWGYAGAISEGFPIWNPARRRDRLRADFVAFTHHEQRDMATSAILAQVVDTSADITSRWLPAAVALGAPAMLVALPDRLTLWTTARDIAAVAEILSVPITAPGTLVSRTANLKPEAVARAKRAGHARSLFPLGLDVLNGSRQQARTYLTQQVEYVLSLGAGERASGQDLAARLVIGALAILMIRDKTPTAALTDVGVGALIDVAQQRHHGYFDWLNNITDREMQSFISIVDYLGSDINFASIEPAMVSDVYEQALVDKFVRREQGTFYTPPQLAQQMLSVIPFESLEPDRRTVLDPACGSGTLLLATADRLTQTQPAAANSSALHNYLVSHISGYDSDSLASEITKLCLLMTAMPIGNSWRVETLDTLAAELNADSRPSVIVSNPPWRFRRAGIAPEERANVFITWMLANLADDGYLACVVPLSWINKHHGRRSRTSLLRQSDLLEVWRLPADLFHSTGTTIAPAVIVARKHAESGYRPHLAVFKTVRNSDTQDFLDTGRAGEAYIVEPGSDGSKLAAGPLSRELAGLEGFVTLDQAADVYTGWSQQSGRQPRLVSDATHMELSSILDLRAFSPPLQESLKPVRYPDDYHHVRATDERVRAAKVIVVSKHFSADNPWRLNVGYDPIGIVVRESFISLIPRPDWGPWASLSDWHRQCAVMAVLGSGLASCWIDENEPTRNISIRYVKVFPFPADRDSISLLANVGERIVNAVTTGTFDEMSAAATQLETVVNDMYRLTDEAKAIVRKRLAGAPAFEGVIRYPPTQRDAKESESTVRDLPSFGQVLEADEQGLRVWVSGVTEVSAGQTPITPGLGATMAHRC